MKAKLLGLLAVGLLAGPIDASADYIYTFSSSQANPNQISFVLTQPSLFTDPTTFQLSDFDSISAPAGTTSVFFWNLLTAPVIDFTGTSVSAGFSSGFTSTGTYCSGVGGCGSAGFFMTITQTAVPEPGTLALLGLGLAGLGLTRRRKAD